MPLGDPDFGKLEICSCRQGQVSQKVHQRLYSLSNLTQLSHLTFENFQPRGRVGLSPLQADSLERAFNQSSLFARSLKGWLLLQGKYGCGKTHLAASIANFTVGLGVPTLFITVPDLLDELRFAYDSDVSFEQRFDEIRNITLLILDDFGTQNATAWAQEKLFQILNYRYINRLPLVVTTNLSLNEIDERIRSRLQDPDLVTTAIILAPDHRNPTDDTGDSELSSLILHKPQTFQSFDDRLSEHLPPERQQSLQKAVLAATDFARNPEGWLILTGQHATGKTHLAAAIANDRKSMGSLPLFVFVPDLLDHLRATFSPSSNMRYDRRFDEIKTTPLLVLDGLGTQSATPWASEKLYQLFDYRFNARLPLVVTMTKSMDELEGQEPHLVSRMLDRRLSRIIAIDVPPYRGAPENKPKRSYTRPRKSPRD